MVIVSFPGDPALIVHSWRCSRLPLTEPAVDFRGLRPPYRALAIMASDSNGTRTFFSRKFNGTSWSGWSQLQGETFHDEPALAGRLGCSFAPETSLFGRGDDDQIWVTTQLSGGVAAFTQLPISSGGQGILGACPRAVGTAGAAIGTAVILGDDEDRVDRCQLRNQRASQIR